MTSRRRHFVNFLNMFRQRKAKDKRNPQRNCTENEEQPSNCVICLDEVSCRGRLGVCKHWFCFLCIFEWSKNNNTCPICKARFRCITKVHLDTLKSPPKKVRVRDIDQRVWNDDDDIVADDLVDLSENPASDDFDDDYEPSVHVTNPWTAQNNRGASDDYDLNDTFINDFGDEVTLVQDDGDDETSDTEECVLPRESPYLLRHSGAAANISLTDSILELANEDCPNIGESSPASTGSFIVSEDDLSDLNRDQWMPPGEHTQNPRKNDRSGHLKAHKEQMNRRKTRATNPARKMPKSQTTVGNQVSTRSKRKVEDTSEEDLWDSGWINMNTRRENMRNFRSLPPSRRALTRRYSRKTNQRGASQMPSDSDDNIPSYSAHNTDSSRPKRKGNKKPQDSPSRGKRRTTKRWTISSGESDESDSDHSIPANNKCLKGKGKELGKEPSPYQSRSSLTNKILTSSEESDESDSGRDDLMPLSYRLRTKSQQPNKGDKVTKPPTETRSTRVSSCQGNSSNSVLQGEQDSGSDNDALDCSMSLNISIKSPSKNAASKKPGKIAVKSFLSIRIKECNKENHGRNARKERSQCKKDLPPTTTGTSDEGCIAPTPQQRRCHSIFTKRCHRSPTRTFEDSGASDAEGCPYSRLPQKTAKMESGVSHFIRGKSSKLTEGAFNDECCVTNVQKSVKQNDSPIMQTRNHRKRRRLCIVNSDIESD